MARVECVRAVRPIAGEAGRQDLARRDRDRWAAIEPCNFVSVNGVIERSTDGEMVERREARVDLEKLGAEDWADAKLGRVVDGDGGSKLRRDLLEHPIGATLLDRSRLRTGREVVAPDDRVGKSRRLSDVRPFMESRVADEAGLGRRRAHD